MTTTQEARQLAIDLDEVHRGHADEGPSSFSNGAAALRSLADQVEYLTSDRDVWKARAEHAYLERDQWEVDYNEARLDRELLIRERDALKADAARYQWLRARLPGSAYRIAGVIYSEGGAGVDAAIDAARAAS